jgi:hypothetical protein
MECPAGRTCDAHHYLWEITLAGARTDEKRKPFLYQVRRVQGTHMFYEVNKTHFARAGHPSGSDPDSASICKHITLFEWYQ